MFAIISFDDDHVKHLITYLVHHFEGVIVQQYGNRASPLVATEAMLSNWPFDIVLVDEMYGSTVHDAWFNCVVAIQNKHPEAHIILMSATNDDSDATRAAERKIGYFALGQSPRGLLPEIRSLLGDKAK